MLKLLISFAFVLSFHSALAATPSINCQTTALVAAVLPEIKEHFQQAALNGINAGNYRHREKPNVLVNIVGAKDSEILRMQKLLDKDGIEYDTSRYRARRTMKAISVACGVIGCAVVVAGSIAKAFGVEFQTTPETMLAGAAITIASSTTAKVAYDKILMTANKLSYWKTYFSSLPNDPLQVLFVVNDPKRAREELEEAGFIEDAEKFSIPSDNKKESSTNETLNQ